jgi:hypothetical protein
MTKENSQKDPDRRDGGFERFRLKLMQIIFLKIQF